VCDIDKFNIFWDYVDNDKFIFEELFYWASPG